MLQYKIIVTVRLGDRKETFNW